MNLALRIAGLTLVGLIALGGPRAWADLPRIVVPSVAVTSSNSGLVFSASNYNLPEISFEMDSEDRVELKVDEGELSLAQTEGLVFERGDGAADGLMLFSGRTSSVNQALDGLVYDPPAGFAGAAHIRLRVIGETALEETWRVSVNGIIDPEAARQALLSGVDAIHSGVQPGRMISYGPQAYDIAYYQGRVSEGPMIAAASWGAGRVLAMPDHQMLNMDSYGDISGAFYRNGLAWLAQSDGLDIGIVTSSQGVADWLSSQGYTDITVANDPDLPAALEEADVFIPPWLGTSLSVEKEGSIGQFIRAGGGLFIADYGVGYIWWWGLPVYNAPGNRLLREAGIGFTAAHRWDTETLSVIPASTAQLDAEALLAILASSPLAIEEIAQQATALFSGIYVSLQPNDALAVRLVEAFGAAAEHIIPSPSGPVSDTSEKALLHMELAQLEATPLDEVQKHRSVDLVFGAVPDDAQRLTSTLSIDPAITRWHSTGLYLPPGELVEVRVPEEVVNLGFRVQVSGHTDDLGHLDTWLRMPRVSRSFPLDASGIQVASPFGGALYVDVGTEPVRAPSFEITFEGVVQAPFFVLGKTTDEAWLNEIRKRPAPYAELVAPNLSISLPSHFIRDLEGLNDLMNFWNGAVALQDQVGMHGHLRTNAERFNVDVQIRQGWLHSGYPIQGPVAAANELVDFQGLLERGSWGWFHELGHEAQRRPDKSWGYRSNPYTFEGSVEVTVNIFTSYVFDQNNIVARGGHWDWTGSRVEVMRQALNGLQGDSSYAAENVGVKLAMFLQLRDSWGWEAFERLFQGYHDTLPAELPADDAEKQDQFLIRFSAVVGHDLSRFLGDTWGLVFSREAANSVGDLPTWMPALGGIEGRFQISPAETRVFDLAGEALSHDGFARITKVSEVEEGTLVALGDGRWAYTPAPGFAGVESFDYTVVSSTGHEMVSTVELQGEILLPATYFDGLTLDAPLSNQLTTGTSLDIGGTLTDTSVTHVEIYFIPTDGADPIYSFFEVIDGRFDGHLLFGHQYAGEYEMDIYVYNKEGESWPLQGSFSPIQILQGQGEIQVPATYFLGLTLDTPLSNQLTTGTSLNISGMLTDTSLSQILFRYTPTNGDDPIHFFFDVIDGRFDGDLLFDHEQVGEYGLDIFAGYAGQSLPWLDSFLPMLIIDGRLQTVVDSDLASTPEHFVLHPNFPNPFNASTMIRYELPSMVSSASTPVQLTIYNLLGHKIRTLIDQQQEPGYHSILWDGRNSRGLSVASGVYFYRISVGEHIRSRRMLLLR